MNKSKDKSMDKNGYSKYGSKSMDQKVWISMDKSMDKYGYVWIKNYREPDHQSTHQNINFLDDALINSNCNQT